MLSDKSFYDFLTFCDSIDGEQSDRRQRFGVVKVLFSLDKKRGKSFGKMDSAGDQEVCEAFLGKSWRDSLFDDVEKKFKSIFTMRPEQCTRK